MIFTQSKIGIRTLGLGLACFAAAALDSGILSISQITLFAAQASSPNPATSIDVRLRPLKTLDDHFPFEPPDSIERWRERAAQVRQQIAVAVGLYPLPHRTPLNASIYGRRDFGEYSIEKACFESFPGFFVTGSLYRPLGRNGPFPGVLSPHGHWNQGRFYDAGEESAAREVADGAEFDAQTARVPLQARCVHLARMGCVVFHYDMIGYADNQQIAQELAHGFAKQRPEMNASENWGLFSPQAESHLQSVMGLQTWNSIRALDFLESLPDVDRSRIAVTGASGGGTQTMILAALDDRPDVVFPAVMVSTSMQGGCTCENASLLRIGTGNVEFAALFAPKPQGLTAANDWTKEMATDGFPQLQAVYRMLGKPENVRLSSHTEFGHNYNAVSRKAMYELFNVALRLNAEVDERSFTRQTPEQLSVWDQDHPRPAGGADFERALLRYWHNDSQRQLEELSPRDPQSAAALRDFLRPAYQAIFKRSVAGEEAMWTVDRLETCGSVRIEHGRFINAARGEQTPAIVLKPTEKSNGRFLIWLSSRGKAALLDEAGQPCADAGRLLNAGYSVVGLDCFWQGDLLPPDADAERGRLVENGREAAGYTFGYNNPIFVCRVHDVFNAVACLTSRPSSKVDLLAIDGMGGVGAAARAMAGAAIDLAAIDTQCFRFGSVGDLRDVNFLPGGAKYGDLPMLIAYASPNPLWLRGEGDTAPMIISMYDADAGCPQLCLANDNADPIDWLIGRSKTPH